MVRLQDFHLATRRPLTDWVPRIVQAAAADLASASLRHAVAGDRQHLAEALAALQSRGVALSAALERALLQELAAAGSSGMPAVGGSPPAPGLALIEQDAIDEDIEVARIVQHIDAQAEVELRPLARLCSSLAGSGSIRMEHIPLSPVRCARALRQAVAGAGLGPAARRLLLRQLGEAMGQLLRPLYASQCEWLQQQGVQPLRFRIMNTPVAPRSAGSGPAVSAMAAGPGDPPGALARLLAWAQQRGPADAEAGASGMLTLCNELRPADARILPTRPAAAPAAPPPGAGGPVLMARLFGYLQEQGGLSRDTQDLLAQLQPVGQRLAEAAAADPAASLWRQLDHPWWQLLDRLLTWDPTPGAAQAWQGALALLLGAPDGAEPGADAARCHAALALLDRGGQAWRERQAPVLASAAAAWIAKADRESLESALRAQLAAQLQGQPASAALREFLLGPWVLALTAAALPKTSAAAAAPGGTDRGMERGAPNAALAVGARMVDDLLSACAPGRAPPTPARRQVLLARCRAGLADAGLTPSRIDAALTQLADALNEPAVPLDLRPLPDSVPLPLHALPTVPIALSPAPGSDPAGGASDAWADGLLPGTGCRLCLNGQWLTAQLIWVSDARHLFVFASRQAGRLFSLTRRALEKARDAGLAASLPPGGLLAQALDTMTGHAD